MVQQLLEITTVSWHRDIDMRPQQGKVNEGCDGLELHMAMGHKQK